MENEEKVITEQDYATNNSEFVWAVTSKGNIMSSNFLTKKDAEHFRDNAYCGYYKNCVIEYIKNHKKSN